MPVVIKRPEPHYYTALRILGVLVLGLILAKIGLADKLRFAERDFGKLAQKNEQLRRENQLLLEQIAILERASQIDKQAYVRVQETIKKLQASNLELEEEVEFYHGILQSTRAQGGLNIQGMRLLALNEGGGYRFRIILTHVAKSGKVAKGSVSLRIEGMRDGKNERLDIRQAEQAGFPFSFKHFSRVEGDFSLPEGFEPQKVQVTVSVGKGGSLVKTFEWSKLLPA